MIGVLVVTHGNLGKELVDIAQAIVGEIPFLEWIGVFQKTRQAKLPTRSTRLLTAGEKKKSRGF